MQEHLCADGWAIAPPAIPSRCQQAPAASPRRRAPAACGDGADQRIERGEHHLGVAGAREAATGVAQRGLLALAGALAELSLEQPHDRAQPLDRLARLVHGALRERPRAISRDELERDVGLLERHPAQPLGQPLAGLSPSRAGGCARAARRSSPARAIASPTPIAAVAAIVAASGATMER